MLGRRALSRLNDSYVRLISGLLLLCWCTGVCSSNGRDVPKSRSLTEHELFH